MDIEREWRRCPPSFNGSYSLTDLVDDFEERRNDPESPVSYNRDDILDYCAQQPSLFAAIKVACRSYRPDGRLHNHQSRVPKKARAKMSVRLIHRRRTIRKCRTFEQLLAIVQDVADVTPGIGPVTTYDVATRVGAYLDLSPRLVYLHAGCEQGARALSLPLDTKLFPQQLPGALTRLTPDEVEDFLCTYRNVLCKIS